MKNSFHAILHMLFLKAKPKVHFHEPLKILDPTLHYMGNNHLPKRLPFDKFTNIFI